MEIKKRQQEWKNSHFAFIIIQIAIQIIMMTDPFSGASPLPLFHS